MDQIRLETNLDKILKICLVLTGISTFAVVVIGISLINLQVENQKLTKFISVAEDARGDFENSLVTYTEKTREIIDYFSTLRPKNEQELVNFISRLEKIEQDLMLNMKLETHEKPATNGKADEGADETVTYKISFFGSDADLNNFLSRVETLPYFVKVEDVDFKDLNYIEKSEDVPPNVNITIKLYIKTNADETV